MIRSVRTLAHVRAVPAVRAVGAGRRGVGHGRGAPDPPLGVPLGPAAAHARQGRVERHRRGDHQGQLGGQPEPGVAVDERHDHHHAADDGHDREDRASGAAQADEAEGAGDGDAVPDDHADLPEHDLLLVDRAVEQQLLLGLVEPERAPDPGGDDVRQPVAVLAGVAVRDLAEPLALGRGVALGHQVLGRLDAGQRPVPDPVALVHLVAVGGAERLVELRRQRGRLLEAGQVVADPGRDDDGGGQARQPQLGEPGPPRGGVAVTGDRPAAPPHQRHRQQGPQQDRFGAHERGQSDDHAERERAAQAGTVPPAVHRPEHGRRRGHHQRLGHHHRVEVEDVGAEGDHDRGDQADRADPRCAARRRPWRPRPSRP